VVEMALLQYRNMQYEDALATIKRALQVDGLSGEANYYYGVINDRLNNTADAKDGYSIAALTQEYRSAAYTALAKLAGKEKQYDQSIRYAQKAIDLNRWNMEALMLEAVTYRYLGDTLKASETLGTILGYDPLNHFARFEYLPESKADEKDPSYFELRLEVNEFTQTTFLKVSDYSDFDDMDELQDLWDGLVENLKKVVGIARSGCGIVRDIDTGLEQRNRQKTAPIQGQITDHLSVDNTTDDSIRCV